MKTLLLAAVTSVIAITTSQAQMPRAYPEAPPVPTRSYPSKQAPEQPAFWQCGLIQVNPRERTDPDPGFKINLTISDRDFYAAHTSISGITRVRGEQYRNIRVWDNGNANWSGVSMENPRLTMIGTFGKDQVTRRLQYVERLYRDGALKTTIVSTCHDVEIAGTANAHGKIHGPQATDAYAMAETSTVTHNGSLMEVSDRGGRMEIRYADPRPGLTNIGVTPGTLLIKGVWVAPEKLEGTAYIFTSRCPALAYRVEGGVDRFGNILLSGPVPVTDYACNIVGYDWKSHNAFLRFDQVTER
jgi:hypothetical protein